FPRNSIVRKKLADILARFRALVVEYGIIALVVHYVIFAIVIVAFWAAINAGWQPTTTIATMSTWGAAYLVAKVVQPFRIIATLSLTPLIARVLRRPGRQRSQDAP